MEEGRKGRQHISRTTEETSLWCARAGNSHVSSLRSHIASGTPGRPRLNTEYTLQNSYRLRTSLRTHTSLGLSSVYVGSHQDLCVRSEGLKDVPKRLLCMPPASQGPVKAYRKHPSELLPFLGIPTTPGSQRPTRDVRRAAVCAFSVLSS